jgi:hypothetical protein
MSAAAYGFIVARYGRSEDKVKKFSPVVGILSVLLAVSDAAYGSDEFVFVANLSGAQEVLGQPPFLAPQPGVETNTTGRFRISFNHALTRAQFRLSVNNGVSITQAHLHCAPAGANGSIAVFLFPFPEAPPLSPGININGLLSEGELTNASFKAGADGTATCGKTVNNIASLRAAMLDGCIYANVHSDVNRGGEVRGQVRPVAEP